ncbi:MAG TPA: hypothetical protein VIG33_09880 [Pseudobdellovibrionaceae bacterium]|jgi:hypothetical protein
MKFVYSVLIFVFALLNSQSLLAQLDSSYELLLGVRAPTTTSPASQKVIKKKKREPTGEESATSAQGPVQNPVQVPQGLLMPTQLDTKTLPSQVIEEPTFAQQAKSLFTANPEKILGFYEEHFEESDPRQNKVDISFASSFVTNDSSSNYSYRSYRSVYAGVNLGANVWLTPAIGIGGNFLFSLGADTSGDAITSTPSPARFEFLDIAVKFRQFYGFAQTSKSVEFDVLYSDFKFNVSTDDVYRAKLKSSGLGLKMTLRLPSSSEVAWLIGGSFYPRLQHVESKAGADISSGNNVENTRLGVQLGSEIKLSRSSQIFYEAALLAEKNLFSGNAKLVDPVTGSAPKNVSITDTFYIFSLGYRWGN